jgi:hypothetical protein
VLLAVVVAVAAVLLLVHRVLMVLGVSKLQGSA